MTRATATPQIPATLAEARAVAMALDAADPLAGFRSRFILPGEPGGRPRTYLAGQSLGAQPVGTRERVIAELDAWAAEGVDGHFRPGSKWAEIDEPLREATARLVGARPHEISTLNTLTVNLHLLMASFFRPSGARTRILIDAPAFPSDRYAAASQLRHHGLDPATELVVVGPRPGEETLRTEDLEAAIRDQGDRLALALLGGVNYATGQRHEMERLTAAVHAVGAPVIWDLAHAAGNVPLRLHDWKVDAAAWCTYKYMNGGPGAIGQLFVHEARSADPDLPRLEGWWGNDPATRFRMAETFEPSRGADAWRLSNQPVLSLVPIAPSLALFEEAGMERLRAKSVALTGFLEALLDRFVPAARIITPRDPEARGCQLSLRFPDARARLAALEARGVVTDFREPDIIRVAPVPLYNTFLDAWTVAEALATMAPEPVR